jgi:hypothetical protein
MTFFMERYVLKDLYIRSRSFIKYLLPFKLIVLFIRAISVIKKPGGA